LENNISNLIIHEGSSNMNNHQVTMPRVVQVDHERWKAAQNFEWKFAQRYAKSGNDDNLWWKEAFDNYKSIQNESFPNVLEVGCGPHTNMRLILPLIKFQKIYFEDPLIHEYLKLRQQHRMLRYITYSTPVSVASLTKKFNATLFSEQLEHLPLTDNSVDLCICINVLDHVEDAQQCLLQVRRVLKPGGVFIIGQDLSNEEDMQLCPESWEDIGHPIKLDSDILDSYLAKMQPLYKKILTREQGRNPRCHYGTYLFIGKQN